MCNVSMVSICKSRCNQRSGDPVAEAGARLWAGSAYVVADAGVLAGRAVEVCDGPRAVGPREASGPGWVGACRGSGCAKIRLSTVAIQD